MGAGRAGEPSSRTPAAAPARVLRVTAENAGERADELVRRGIAGLSRMEVRRLFAERRVSSSGRILDKGERLAAGCELLVQIPEREITPDVSLELEIVHESADFVIAEKPAGLPTAPLVRTATRSLAAALLARYPELARVGFRAREPGLVHRLDTQTSGLVLAARTQLAFVAARRALEAGAFQKRYLAVVAPGIAEEGKIAAFLAPDPARGGRVRAFGEPPPSYHRAALTEYRVRERGRRFWLLELYAGRAFRHQIRAHLAYAGFPIAGDKLYGGPDADALGERHALHASYMEWAGDATLRGFAAESALPAALRALLEA
jgi:23S rRNA pseudouridine1911/1915/1917 synthase